MISEVPIQIYICEHLNIHELCSLALNIQHCMRAFSDSYTTHTTDTTHVFAMHLRRLYQTDMQPEYVLRCGI